MFPLRGEGDLRLRCPACPEIGVNVDAEDVTKTPDDLKHTVEQRFTSDGNFQLNQYMKRREDDDHSFWEGNGYFPSQAVLGEYLRKADVRVEASQQPRKRLPATTNMSPKKSTCSFLKAVNNQNQSKFKNMRVTGVVNTQCDHVFVWSTVDLQKGEK